MQGTLHSPTDTHLISPEVQSITQPNEKCEDSLIRFLCKNAPRDSNSSIEKDLVTDFFFHIYSKSIKREIKFIKVLFKKIRKLQCLGLYIPFKLPTLSPKRSSPCLCSTFQLRCCTSSFCTDAIFCFFIHGISATMRSSFVEAFQRDVWGTKLPLIQVEMLSCNGSLKQKFCLVFTCPQSQNIFWFGVSSSVYPV